jgi:N-methylhydantoinase B
MSAASAPQTPVKADALELEVFRYAVRSILDELEINLTRTAYSELITDYQDYCIAVVTSDFRLVAQSTSSIPIFIADMGRPIRDAVELVGADSLQPGDVLVTNYSPVSGQHLNNVTCLTPLFDEDGIVGYLGIRSHWADVGGLAPGGQSSASRSIFHEGTQYRGLRLVRAGVIAPEVLATLQANTWQPAILTGDLMAQLAACGLVHRRWEERIQRRWAGATVRSLIETQLEASARFARSAVAALPDGEYSAAYPLRYEEHDVSLDLELRLTLRIDGEKMIVDLTEMPDQVELPINAGSAGDIGARVGFKTIVAPDWPTDESFFSPLEVITREGSIVHATGDAPMAHWNTTIPFIVDLMVRAIGLQHPTLVPASHFMSIAGLMFVGQADDGSYWRCIWAAAGGLGATADADGYGPVKCAVLGDTKTPPLEMVEARFPMVHRRHALLPEAGGPGRHRGGPGVERVIEVTEHMTVDASPGAPSQPAPGLAGGGEARLGYSLRQRPGSSEWEPISSSAGPQPLAPGEIVRFGTGGGGGWGAPEEDR